MSIIIVWFETIKEHPSYLIPILIGMVTLVVISFEKVPVYEMLTSDEALQNVASVYNANDMIVNNLTVTGTIKTGSLTSTGNITSDSLNVAKNTNIGGTLTSTGTITSTNGNVTAPKGSTIAINSYMSGGIEVTGDVRSNGWIWSKGIPVIRYGDQLYIANSFGRGNISTGDGNMKTSKNTADYEAWKLEPSNATKGQNSTATTY